MAGLAAADTLTARGLDVVVLEARDRIGGRILTRRDPAWPVPVELGAEFLHGEAPSSRALGRETGALECRVDGAHWSAARGAMPPGAYWEPIERVLRRVSPEGPDRSFDDHTARSKAAPADIRQAREFVAGYHAADPARLGIRSIAAGRGEDPAGSARRLGRFLDGYDALPARLATRLAGRIRLDTTVTAIDWRRGHARLAFRDASGAHRSLECRVVLLTVPIGVWQAAPGEAGAIDIRPAPTAWRRAIDRLAMGHVAKLVLRFDAIPWPRAVAADGLPAILMIHSGRAPFRIFWTGEPLAVPTLVAWSGGPEAEALRDAALDERVDQALGCLAAAFGTTRARLRRRLVAAAQHDWSADPYARGAYSYALVGGADAPRRLTAPIDDTLFMAGEAVDVEGGTGTVEGALASGRRVAARIRRCLGQRKPLPRRRLNES